MRRVYSHEHGMMADYIKCCLEGEQIACIVKNQSLSGGVGEIPPIECWPEVWVLRDEDYEHAKRIVDDLNRIPKNASWVCHCGEKLPGQFTDCWHCGLTKPD